jgi:hypothetical protein
MASVRRGELGGRGAQRILGGMRTAESDGAMKLPAKDAKHAKARE